MSNYDYLDKKKFYVKNFFVLFFVSGCVGDWSLGSGKQEKWTLVINRIRRSVWADAI